MTRDEEITEGHGRQIHSGKVKIWDEVTVTIRVGDGNYLKFSHGQERLVRNNGQAIAKAERTLNENIREVVEARIEEYKMLIEEV